MVRFSFRKCIPRSITFLSVDISPELAVALDRVFAAAYIDNGVRHKIFGRYLRPFSLWHLLLLQTIDSPFVTGGEVSLFDLKTAIGICSLRYRKSKVRRPTFPLFMGLKKLKKNVDRFMVYVGDYLNRPDYTIQPLDPRAPQYVGMPIGQAPAPVITAYRACQGARLPISQIWDMPIGEAYISEAMFFHNQGERVDFMDDNARKFQEDMKKSGVVK